MIDFEPGSFKDPDGRVFYHRDSVFRTLSAAGHASMTSVAESDFFRQLLASGSMIDSEIIASTTTDLPKAEVSPWLIRQAKVPVVTYPFEWSFDMLRDAALLTLQTLEQALAAGYVLKDATPFNVLFDRNRPVLIDVLSLEKRQEGEPWAGYAQFCRGFLFPLLINAYKKIDFQPLLRSHMGEIPLSVTRNLFSASDALRPGILKDIWLQHKLDRGFATNPESVKQGASSFLFSTEMILVNVRRLRKIIEGLRYTEGLTTWGGYTEFHNYTQDDEATKRQFVGQTLERRNPGTCLDLGCNTGVYSEIAMTASRSVISIDIDPEAINALYLKTRDQSRHHTLLVADLSNPTPALGWGLAERKSLFSRLNADFFLGLALIHHLRITAGIPLEMIVEQFTRLAPEGIVEWVDKKDSMIRRMLSLRKDVYDDYSWDNFEALLKRRFHIERVVETHEGNRKLCHVTRRE